MNNGDLTISVLAGLDVDAKGSGLTKEDRQQLVTKLQDKAHEIAALQPYAVGPRMLELLTDALRQSVAEALGEIWKQRKELREAASKGTTADIEKADVSLFDHSATWTLKPSITIKVTNPPPGLPAFTIPLNVVVTFTLQNVQMEIERAHITKFMMGKLKSKVEIKYKEYPLSAPFEKEVHLPGELVLPGGGIDLS